MKDNYCVIMGGGIGSRFWPFSRESYPKQFLDFFGTGRSLLQMTFDRFAKIIPVENIFIVTNEQYATLIHEQLPELSVSQILLEPARRNTAPCIAYAAYHIRACNPNANIVVAPSDHLILKEDVFLKDVSKGLEFVKQNSAVLREVGGNARIDLVSYRKSGNGSVIFYDISVQGTKTVYAIVNVSRESGQPVFSLACTTPLYMGMRDAYKHPCDQ